MSDSEGSADASSPLAKPAGAGDRVIAQGEGMARLALESGHFWQTLWDLPENAALREARGHPEVLLPGDRVTVPPLRQKKQPAATGQTHRFRRRGMPVKLTWVVRDAEGRPFAGKKYELAIEGATVATNVTGDDGVVSHWVDPAARSGTLTLWPGGAAYPEKVVWNVAIDHLGPVDTAAGMMSRLNSLGYAAGTPADTLTPAAQQALMEFQEAESVDITGTIDAATIAAMRIRFGG